MALLDGVRVIDLADPRTLLTGRILSDLGADVVRVEPPGGSEARTAANARGSYLWDAYAAGSRSVIADIDSPEGRSALIALIGVADILITPYLPTTLAAAGLTGDVLEDLNPRLVHVSVTAFGLSGPKAEYQASDLVVWAAGGPLDPHRDGDRAPVRISVPQAYLHACADAADGALFALLARRRTGRGQVVDVSAQASLTTATLGRALAAAVGDEAPEWERVADAPRRVDQSGSGANTDPTLKKWPCKDGLIELHLAVGPAAGGFTTAFFRWMNDEGAPVERFASMDWREVPALLQSGDLIDEDIAEARKAVAEFLATRTKAQVLEAARDRRLVAVPIYDTADIHLNPQAEARQAFTTVGEGGRAARVQRGFAVISGERVFRNERSAPSVGEQHEEVLRDWLGGTPIEPDRSCTESGLVGAS